MKEEEYYNFLQSKINIAPLSVKELEKKYKKTRKKRLSKRRFAGKGLNT